MEYVVTLDLLSGLPNPQWRLTGVAADELTRRLNALALRPGARAQIPPALGYRGVVVNPDSSVPTGVRYHVYHGSVTADGGYLADPDRNLELWLIDSGTGLVPDELLAVAKCPPRD